MPRDRTPLILLALSTVLGSVLSCRALASPSDVAAPSVASPNSGPSETPATASLAASTSTRAAPTGTAAPTATLFDFGGQFNATPLPSWHGIPIMPGALLGGESSGVYGFSTAASPADVSAYYSAQIPLLGYRPGPGNGTPDPSGLMMLIFYGSPGQAVMVNIMTVKGVTIVMLGT